jgi:hypothetical protein
MGACLDMTAEKTHSMGECNPSTFPRRLVNLHMNEYTNNDSQRSEGCFASDGGHMWPFFSACDSGAAMLMFAKRARRCGAAVGEKKYKSRVIVPPHYMKQPNKYITTADSLFYT